MATARTYRTARTLAVSTETRIRKYDPLAEATWEPIPQDTLAVGLHVEAVDKENMWYDGKIAEGPIMRHGAKAVKIHYHGWNKCVAIHM